MKRGVGSGEWYLTARAVDPLHTVAHHSPPPTPLELSSCPF
jgi:hypothetical protein